MDTGFQASRRACGQNGARFYRALSVIALLAVLALLALGRVESTLAATSNIAATRHNLSTSGLFPVKSTTETEICAFCHTPHNANTAAQTPLWNRTDASTYTRYTSSSLDANAIADGFNDQPAGSSLLCLSCHDGTVALGKLNVLRGAPANLTISNSNANNMPNGAYGAYTGYTRNLGTDLTNDHPISITYNDALAQRDGDLTRLTTAAPAQRDQIDSTNIGRVIGLRSSGYKPLLPLESTGRNGVGQIQCATCHDPHITATKFLRLSRTQLMAPDTTWSGFDDTKDQICLACHPKAGWRQSAHASSVTADEAYIDAAADLREFTRGSQVWQAACLNCHDTHTAQGTRRLMREGVNSATTGGIGAGTYQMGSTTTPINTVSSIENTCYQCHSTTGAGTTRIIGTVAGSTVPDIKTEFNRTVHMPILTADQKGTFVGSTNNNTAEVHDIVDANFTEPQVNLGLGNISNRHVECTDCHNPHRVRRGARFYDVSSNTAGDNGAKRTHLAGGTTTASGADGNVASGVLRGIWGVQPDYGIGNITAWPKEPSYTVKKGDPGTSSSIATDSTTGFLTREYQLCLKCHSDYANTIGSFPPLGNTAKGTASTTNGLTSYTNVASEFAVNANDAFTGSDQGENNTNATYKPAIPNGAPDAAPTNHRSWHPVMFPTGRTRQARTNSTTTDFTNIRPPFNTPANIGRQTMYCSDCHGEPTSWIIGANTQYTTGGPDSTKTQGPHGSSENFLLKGKWDYSQYIGNATGATPTAVCGRCHDPSGNGGFSNGDAGHSSNSDHNDTGRCMYCHIAVPHGWKNKAFLVNLNCIGPEVGKPAGCTSAALGGTNGNTGQMWKAPYYNGALLRINTWKASTTWTDTSCGTSTNNARNWMDATCQAAATSQSATQTTSY